MSKLTLLLPPLVTKQQQMQIQQFCFESLGVSQLLLSCGGAFPLYASGRTEGLLLNVGDTSSYCLSVLDSMT